MFDNVAVALALLLSASICNAEEGGKIIGGSQVSIADYPYQLSLRSFGSHICGASIVGKQHAVTAAHCTDGAQAIALSVRAGTSMRTEGGIVIGVAKIYQHPKYNASLVDNDISVLKIATPLTYSSLIQPIALCLRAIPDGGMTTVSGWGTYSANTRSLPVYLQAVQVPKVSDAKCKQQYDSIEFTEHMICAGYEEGGKDTCLGDSGGPLNYDGKLCGLTSWGIGCGDPGHYGVYTDVNDYIDYIKNIMGKE